METQAIVIWARYGSGSLILWSADSKAVVYVADRRRAGDPHMALNVGDIVDLTVKAVGKMRVGHSLRYHGTCATWITQTLSQAADGHRGMVMSPDGALRGAVVHGAGAPRHVPAANRRRDIGAA